MVRLEVGQGSLPVAGAVAADVVSLGVVCTMLAAPEVKAPYISYYDIV